MIPLKKLRELNLASGAPQHLSAASGLVRLGAFIYVVADDELHLGVFPAEGQAPGRLLRLFDGALPAAKEARKRQKPDLEAITRLPPFGRYPNGALLMLGSGSTPNRRLGALLSLDAQDAIAGAPRVVDFAPLLATLDREFPSLNIEGAAVSGDTFKFFQRGNRQHPRNAIIRFPLAAVLDALDRGEAIGPLAPVVDEIAVLGDVDGVPLTVTDAAALPDGGMVIAAVAEDTTDTYNDGPCVGAAIAVLDEDGCLRSIDRLEHAYKIEGVDALIDGNSLRLLLVTDADDASVPASLFSAAIAG